MDFSYTKQLLDLIKDTKSYFSQQPSDLFINLSSNEMTFFSEEIKDGAPKIRKKEEKKELLSKLPISSVPMQVIDSSSQGKIEKKEKKETLPPLRPALSFSNTTKLKPAIMSKIQKKTEEPSSISVFTALEKPPKSELSFGDMKNIIKEAVPNYILVDIIPPDKKAKDISQAWKMKKCAAEITILSFRESPQQLLFLKSLAQAIDIMYMPTKVVSGIEIEQENQWGAFFSKADLKLIIACDYSILSFPNLVTHYKEIPAHRQHFLSDIPLFMLPDISLYLKDPMLKKSLWVSLKNKILLLADK